MQMIYDTNESPLSDDELIAVKQGYGNDSVQNGPFGDLRPSGTFQQATD
jgi:hypothetical protein